MMTRNEITTATRDELTAELAAAGEYTEDADRADMDDLRDRVTVLIDGWISAGLHDRDE
jgi:hypothetical protein